MATKAPSKEELLALGVSIYTAQFKGVPSFAGCGPGRVNLIGEHTDYNEGFVFPMALPNVTVLVGSINGTDDITIYSNNMAKHEAKVTFPIPSKKTPTRGEPGWANYVKGVINFFADKHSLPGFNAVVVSSVPLGAGLSSSAALEVATFTFLEALTRTNVSKKEKALLCQKAEHVYAQMPCGIMDQYISIFGEEGHALLLDCKSLTHQQISFGEKNICILITNSNVKHKLDGSEYPLRAAQCREASTIMGVRSLREASTHDLDKYRRQMTDEVFRRARHVISEIARTASAAQALRQKDYASFGMLMFQSHTSLREDYEVSIPELDQLVDIAMNCKGVYGSRLTGAGFGGSTVTLLKADCIEETLNKINQEYQGRASFNIARPSSGAEDVTPFLEELLQVNREHMKDVIEALEKSSQRKLDFYEATPSSGGENLTSLLQEFLQNSSLSNKRSTMTQTKSLVK